MTFASDKELWIECKLYLEKINKRKPTLEEIQKEFRSRLSAEIDAKYEHVKHIRDKE